MRRLIVLSLVCAALLITGPAMAGSDNGGDDVVLAIVVPAVVIGSLSTIGGVVGAVGLGNAVAKDERPELAWRVLGYTTGAVNLIGGSLLLSLAAIDEPDPINIVPGVSLVALGSVDLGLAIAGELKTGRPASTVAVLPTLFPRAKGAPTPGLALTVAGF